MTVNKSKIRCPKCRTVYSIDDGQNDDTWKKSAKCAVCESRFIVENRGVLRHSEDTGPRVTFLKTYFEKRRGITERRISDRRKEVEEEYLNEFEHDIIPIFNDQGSVIIGHISPGRRRNADRRSGIERRQYLMDRNNREEDLFAGYELNGSAGQIDN